jgi:hypothetical protein
MEFRRAILPAHWTNTIIAFSTPRVAQESIFFLIRFACVNGFGHAAAIG